MRYVSSPAFAICFLGAVGYALYFRYSTEEDAGLFDVLIAVIATRPALMWLLLPLALWSSVQTAADTRRYWVLIRYGSRFAAFVAAIPEIAWRVACLVAVTLFGAALGAMGMRLVATGAGAAGLDLVDLPPSPLLLIGGSVVVVWITLALIGCVVAALGITAGTALSVAVAATMWMIMVGAAQFGWSTEDFFRPFTTYEGWFSSSGTPIRWAVVCIAGIALTTFMVSLADRSWSLGTRGALVVTVLIVVVITVGYWSRQVPPDAVVETANFGPAGNGVQTLSWFALWITPAVVLAGGSGGRPRFPWLIRFGSHEKEFRAALGEAIVVIGCLLIVQLMATAAVLAIVFIRPPWAAFLDAAPLSVVGALATVTLTCALLVVGRLTVAPAAQIVVVISFIVLVLTASRGVATDMNSVGVVGSSLAGAAMVFLGSRTILTARDRSIRKARR